MFCTKCGKELSDNAFMCPDCGEPISNYNDYHKKHILNSVANQQTNSQVANSEQKKNIFAVLGFTCALISIILSIPYFISSMIAFLDGSNYIGAYLEIVFFIIPYVLISLLFSIVGIYSPHTKKNSKEWSFALSGIIISSIALTLITFIFAVAIFTF